MNTFKNTEDFIKFVQSCRKESRNKWFSGHCWVGDYHISYKFFNTWFQRLQVGSDGICHSNSMESKVGEMKEFLTGLNLD